MKVSLNMQSPALLLALLLQQCNIAMKKIHMFTSQGKNYISQENQEQTFTEMLQTELTQYKCTLLKCPQDQEFQLQLSQISSSSSLSVTAPQRAKGPWQVQPPAKLSLGSRCQSANTAGPTQPRADPQTCPGWQGPLQRAAQPCQAQPAAQAAPSLVSE